MMYLLDRDEVIVGPLKDVTAAKQTEEVNGLDTLDLETTDERIAKGYRVVFKDEYGNWREYIAREVTEQHTAGEKTKSVYLESSIYETIGDYVEDKRPAAVAANIALADALETTRWEVGQVDDLGINSTNFYHITAMEAIQKAASVWLGEIRTRVEVSGNRITHRYVDLLGRRGADNGKRFTYTKGLASVKKTVLSDDVITALYGYGKGEEVGDGYGRRLTFADINGGKSYVENLEALAIWGRPNGDGTKSHIYGHVEFDDITDPAQLLALTQEQLAAASVPKVTYEASVTDLNGADLGDTVILIDREFIPELRLKARASKIERDLLHPENTALTLGNYRTIADTLNAQEDYINNFRSKEGVWDRANAIGPDGTVAANLDGIVGELNTRINAAGGYVYLDESGEGLITYDRPIDQNPTAAIQLKGGAFRIANSKNGDGTWAWRTFGDGGGFVADLIIAGILKGGSVNFDLTNGTLTIGDADTGYALQWDGSRLILNGTGVESIATKSQLDAVTDSVDQAKTDMAADNASTYTTQADFASYQDTVSTQFTQTAEDFNFQFQTLQGNLDAQGDNTQGQLDTISKYIRFVDGNIILGEQGNEITLQIENDRISFLQNLNEVAYFSNNKLYITDGQILTSLTIGNYSFIPRANGNLSFKKN